VDFSKFVFADRIVPSGYSVDAPVAFGERRYARPLQQFARLRESESDMAGIEDYLTSYATNHARKAMALHQELDDHWLNPIARKLVKKTTGRNYEQFRRRRQRAIAAFDARTHMRNTFLEQLPEIPSLTVRTGDILDPVLKYRKNARDEERLAEFLARSAGRVHEPEQFAERDTMNLKKWAILAQTRFYHGKSEEPTAKGKRVFDGKFASSVLGAVDQYEGPPARAVRTQRSWEITTAGRSTIDLV